MKKRMMIYSLITTLAFFDCKKTSDENSKGEIDSINYGTQFGECLGYCKNEIVLNAENRTLIKSDWAGALPVIKCTLNMKITLWDSLQNSIDLDKMRALPKVIGCPDCADGGAEWIEIALRNGEKIKVTYEYSKEPSDLTPTISKLRKELNSNYCIHPF